MKRTLWIFLLFFLAGCSSAVITPDSNDFFRIPTATLQGANSNGEGANIQTPLGLPAAQVLNVNVAYIKDGIIWLWRGSGNPESIAVKASALKLSDDGSEIAFMSGGHLWAVNAAGGDPRQLENLEASSVVSEFEFQPGTHTIYFNTQSQGIGTPVMRNDLYSVDDDNPQARELLKPGQGGQFTFSPDGTKLALAQQDKINIANLDGGNLKTVLTFASVTKKDGQSYIPQVVWLSNSFGFKTVIPSADGSTPARYLFIAAEGGPAAQLALIQAAPVAKGYFPLISPGSDNVAYLREQGGNLELHIIDASTADKMILSQPAGKLGLLGWTPDAKSVYFWRDNPQQVWLQTLGTEAVPLADSVSAGISWLDAEHFLFLNGSELRIGAPGQASQLIDTGNISVFDGVTGQ